MLPLINMRNARALGLRQNITPVALVVPVQRNAISGDYEFTFDVQVRVVNPDGSTGNLRQANNGEVTCRVQYNKIALGWTDYAAIPYAGSGTVVTVASANLFIPNTTTPGYRVTAKHVASGAEVGMTFNIDASGNVSPMSAPIVISAGSTQPGTFQQQRSAMRPLLRQNIPARKLGFHEVRNFPFQTGYGANLHAERPRYGIAYPEYRQWPIYASQGPNPAMPGTLIRVRQDNAGPGHRNVAI